MSKLNIKDLKEAMEIAEPYIHQEDFEGIMSILDKHFEVESRKDRLVVGSKWVCVVSCYGEHWQWNKNDEIEVEKIDSNVFVGSGCLRDNLPLSQFLLCFNTEDSIKPPKRITWEVFQEVTVEVPVGATEEEITLIQSSTMCEQFPGFFCEDWKEDEEEKKYPIRIKRS